jgi:hypothetical protein
MTMWNKLGTAGKGRYGVWVRFEQNGNPVYRIQRAPIIPQGLAGYKNLEAYLQLIGVSFDETVI